jgi:adenylate cyclase
MTEPPDTSPLDAVRAALDEPRPHRLADVAVAADVEEEVLRRLFDVMGRDDPDDRYADRDVTYARDLAVLLRYAPLDVVERECRMRRRAVTQIVVNDLASVRLQHLIDDAVAQGWSHADLGQALAHIAEVVMPAVGRLLAEDHRQILTNLLDSGVVEEASRDLDKPIDMAVGFVDLVGFTRLSAAADPEELGVVLTAFEELAAGAADDVGDVLLAKTIGDAVMLVGGDTECMDEVLWRIVASEPPGLEDIGRRAGMAAGEVIVRDGDYVGTTVNTAARLTDLARPGSLVVTADAAERVSDRWQQSRLPAVKLKGLGRSRPVRLRPPEV